MKEQSDTMQEEKIKTGKFLGPRQQKMRKEAKG